MNVLFLTTSFPAYKGHVQSPFIYELARHVAKESINLTVVCPFYKKSAGKEERMDNFKVARFQYMPGFMQTLTEEGGIPSQLKRSLWAKIQLPFFLMFFFFKSLRMSKNFDLIHCQWALSGLVGVWVKKIRKIPLIVTLRGADVNVSLTNSVFRCILRYVVRNSDYVTSNNRQLLLDIKKLGINNDIRPIYNGVDVSVFKPRNKKYARKKLGLNANDNVIIYVGWFIERKGVSYLLEAMPSIIKNVKNAKLLLVGEGMLENELRSIVKGLNMQNNVVFAGAKGPDEISSYLNAADVLVLPSLSEGLPNVVLEAMASSLPVVATKVSGTPEVVKDGMTGYLVPAKDSKSLADKTAKLLNDSKLTAKMGKNALRFIHSEGLTWKKSAQRYVEAYKVVLNGKA